MTAAKRIPEEEAVRLLGLKDAKTLRRLITRKRIFLSYTQVTRKSKRFYNSTEVEKVLSEHSYH